MPYNFMADSIHTKKQVKCNSRLKTAVCVFDPPLGEPEKGGGLKDNVYDVHLRLVG